MHIRSNPLDRIRARAQWCVIRVTCDCGHTYPRARARSLKGTKTEKNLLKAFAGESQARNRYTFFASIARKEGYIQIQNIFEETVANEKEHAEIFFKYLEGRDVEITASYPAGKIGTTEENLLASQPPNRMHK